jgi:hypothetical protein
MLPGATAAAADDEQAEVQHTEPPRWKKLLVRAAVVAINYAQATQGVRTARRASERREKDMPRYPLF